MATVNGYAYYAMVNKPASKFQKESSKNPLDKEYKVDLLMNANDYKVLAKKYPKQKKDENLTAAQFEKRYGMEPPADIKMNADDEYCIMSFKTIYAYKDSKTKEIVYMDKPKVLIKDEETGKLKETLANVGNGSKVMLQYVEFTSKEWNMTSAKLKALRVDNLIPYGDDDFSELGDVDESSFKDSKQQAQDDSQEDDEFGDDVPFEMDDGDDDYN